MRNERLQFQVDRIAFFSDALIAIAITLVIIEIKIPEFSGKESWDVIKSKLGNTFWLPVLVCFITIGNLWQKHHELYQHIIGYNKTLVKRNLYFLLTIMFLPLTTTFLFSNSSESVRITIFLANLFLCNYFIICS